MAIKYPAHKVGWASNFDASPFSSKGKLSPVGLEWASQLDDVQNHQIRTGLELLSHSHPKYPPSTAMEFRSICLGLDNEWNGVLNDILLKLSNLDGHVFTSQVAYNVWRCFGHNPALKQQTAEIARECKKVFGMLDRDAMLPLPRETKNLLDKPKPVSVNAKQEQRIRTRFLATLVKVLISMEIPMPKLIENHCNNGTAQLMVDDYLTKGYEIPALAEKENLISELFIKKQIGVRKVYFDNIKNWLENGRLLDVARNA